MPVELFPDVVEGVETVGDQDVLKERKGDMKRMCEEQLRHVNKSRFYCCLLFSEITRSHHVTLRVQWEYADMCKRCFRNVSERLV